MVEQFLFGTNRQAEEIQAFRIRLDNGMSVTLLEYGASVQSWMVPTANGLVDIVLGYDSLAEYERKSAYFGATVGRVANRISHGRFQLGSNLYQLYVNDHHACLHGGNRGLSFRKWVGEAMDEESVRFSIHSPEGEEGFPGAMDVEVLYQLTEEGLSISYSAAVTKACPVSLTNHSYFNLAGQGTILDHNLWVYADAYTPVDKELIPLGKTASVAGTPFDFRIRRSIGEGMDADDEQIQIGSGYDHNFCILGEGFRKAAILWAPDSSLALEVWSDRPGLQIYTSGALEEQQGKNGVSYVPYSGIALETQTYPDAVNQENFEADIAQPGTFYTCRTMFCIKS